LHECKLRVTYRNFYRAAQKAVAGSVAKVHVVAPGDQLSFTNDSFDFVVNSHVLEHFWDPIKAIEEWLRIVRPGVDVFLLFNPKYQLFG
jgi:ubiquinone/menaquinone biosynthesis C-methylase UbiE